MELTPKAMADKCAGCAFTPGTLAHGDRFVAIKVATCLQSRTPFYCHENAVDDVIPEGQARVCRGYIDAVGASPAATPADRLRARALLQWVANVDAGRLGDVPDGVPVVEVP